MLSFGDGFLRLVGDFALLDVGRRGGLGVERGRTVVWKGACGAVVGVRVSELSRICLDFRRLLGPGPLSVSVSSLPLSSSCFADLWGIEIVPEVFRRV